MLDVPGLLDYLGIPYKHAGRNNVMICCVNPDHEDIDPSLSIHKETGLMYCFGCHMSGNIFTLFKHLNISYVDMVSHLMKFSLGGGSEEEIRAALLQTIQREMPEQDSKAELLVPKHRLITEHPYLTSRNITSEEAKLWKMGIVTDTSYTGWLYIPLYQHGLLRTYFLRSPYGIGKLYPAVDRSDVIAGIDFCRNYAAPLCITEGIIDSIHVSRTGFQCGSVLSNIILPEQQKLLQKYSELIIIPDNDAPGEKLVESAFNLYGKLPISVVFLPEQYKDAAECTSLDIITAINNRVDIQDVIVMYNRRRILYGNA